MFTSSATTIPNPNLVPETGLTYEGGFRLHFAEATLKVTAFNGKYENFLQTVAVPLTGCSCVHPVAEYRQGRGQWHRAGRALAGHADRQPVRQRDLSARHQHHHRQAVAVPGAVQGAGRGAICRDRRQLFVDGRGRLGDQQEPDRHHRGVPTSGYAIPKLYATLQLGQLIDRRLGDTKLILGVENIFDTAYRDAATYVNRSNVNYRESLTNPLVEVGRNFTAKLQHTF